MTTSKVRASHEDSGIVFGKTFRMKTNFRSLIKLITDIDKPILFFNVGFIGCSGDSYGPMLGTILKDRGRKAVMGTEANWIGAQELANKIEEAKRLYPDHVVIATDSCVGNLTSIGTTIIKEGMLQAGAGTGKMLPPIGDYSLEYVTSQQMPNATSTLLLMMCANRDSIKKAATKAADAIMLGLSRRAERLAESRSVKVLV